MLALTWTLTLSWLLSPEWQTSLVAVFRHHYAPGMVSGVPWARDEEIIFQKIKEDPHISFVESMGGSGSGYELRLMVRDLGAWQKLVTKLRESKSLTYYTDWQKDSKGYGLLGSGR